MIFPIGDDQVRGGHRPTLSYMLIAANILVFIFQISLSEQGINGFLHQFGAVPSQILDGQNLPSLLTSMFLHGGYMHVFGNMLFLWVFADNIEAIIGTTRFGIFYIVGGLFAAAAHIASSPTSTVIMIGASGAIAAVMGAYLIMFPRSRVKMTVLFLWSFYLPAFLFLGFWIAQQFMNGYTSLSDESGGGVAWWAHIGGFVYGIWFGLRNRYLVREENEVATSTQNRHQSDGEYV